MENLSNSGAHLKNQREFELYKLMSDSLGIGFWEMNLLTQEVYWDDITRQIHEVDESFVPTLDSALSFYKDEQTNGIIDSLIKKYLKTKKPWDVEFELTTAKGNDVWVRVVGKVLFENEKPKKIIGTFQNVNMKYKLQKQIQEQEKRYRLANQAANVGIWEYIVETQEVIWDEMMFKLYGTDSNCFSGVYDAWESAIHPEDKEASIKELELALLGQKKFDISFRVVWPNGEIRMIQAIAEVHRDSNGKPYKMIGTNWDITELKKTEAERQDALDKLKAVFAASTDVSIVSTDVEGVIQMFNSGAERLTGYKAEEVVGKQTPLLFHDQKQVEERRLERAKFWNKDLKSFEVFTINAMNGKADAEEWNYIHRAGSITTVQLVITAMYSVDKKLKGFLGVAVDITRLKKVKNDIRSLLKITENQNHRLKNFAHIVSHNLRSYASNFSMLLNIAENKDVDFHKEIFPLLVSASNSLTEAISHLNEVATINVRDGVTFEAINLKSAVESALLNTSALLKEVHATVELEIDAGTHVVGEKAYVESVFNNLITNSIKYRSKTNKLKIKISEKRIDTKILVSLSDNGLGMDLKKYGSKVFGMYKTFHGNKDARGIGLFISKNQIEAMGGRIEVESEPNCGCTFKLELNASS